MLLVAASVNAQQYGKNFSPSLSSVGDTQDTSIEKGYDTAISVCICLSLFPLTYSIAINSAEQDIEIHNLIHFILFM